MFSFRITESIWSLIILILLQLLVIYSLIFMNDFQNYTKIVHKTNNQYLNTINKNNVNLNDGSFLLKVNSFLKRVQLISQDLWNYLVVFSQTINNNNNTSDPKSLTERMLKELSEMKNVIQLEANSLSESLSIEDWRQSESKQLSQLIVDHLNKIQNPTPEQCTSGQSIICNHTNSNGFASGLHDIVWCLIAGYYSNKTVVLLTKRYHYLKEGSNNWTDFFIPLSNTCDESLFDNTSQLSLWPGSNNPVTRRLIHYLPKSIGHRIVSFHSNPMVWWLGFFAQYVMRPQPRIQRLINQTKLKLDFTHPIVGLQVRRTDKIGTESSFHDLSEYMAHIDDYYNRIELLNDTIERKVYLATDDPNVWKECSEKYPQYKFIGNQKASFYASKLKTRYNEYSFLHLLLDIYLLSETDYIVCTMSSGVCRLAFELMQKHFTDGGFRGQSIDVPFHYEFAQSPTRVAIYNHKPTGDDQWSLQIGDTLHARNGQDFIGQAIRGKKYDSYFYGTNAERTYYHKYPAYKTIQKILLY